MSSNESGATWVARATYSRKESSKNVVFIVNINLLNMWKSCGELPSMCPSQTQDPLVIQGKRIIHLDQDKLCLAQEVRDFLLPQCQTEWTDQAYWDFQIDKPTQLKFPGIERMVNHTWCLSNGLNDIYTQKLVSISDIDIYKCTVNYMVRDFCMTTSNWHQSATLAWYDCPIHAKMKALIVLLRLIINLPWWQS